MIVHIQTQITTTLGRLDNNGNVVEMRQITGQPKTLDTDAFTRIEAEIAAARKAWQEDVDAGIESNNQAGNPR